MMRILGAFLVLILAAPVAVHAQVEASGKVDRSAARRLLRAALDAFDAGQFDQTSALLDTLQVVDSDNPDGARLRAIVYLTSADTLAAVAVLETAVVTVPRSARLKLLLARLYLDLERIEEAEALVDDVLRIRPRESEALYFKGLIVESRGDTVQAVNLFEGALEAHVARNRK